MGETEIIPIPCDDYDLREMRLIEALISIARKLEIEPKEPEENDKGAA